MATAARRPPGRPRLGDTSVPTTEQIVQVAGDLFMGFGYRAVTVEMVADRAGVTKAAVYYHFADKAALLREALVAMFGRVRRATARILAAPTPLYDRLASLAEMVLALPEPLARFEILLREAQDDLSPEQLAGIRAAEDAVGEDLVAAMSAAVDRGEIGGIDPVLLAHAYMSLLRVGQVLTPTGGLRFPDHAESARELMRMLWYGVAGGATPPATDAPDALTTERRAGSRRIPHAG